MIASLSSVTGDGDSAVVVLTPMPTISQSGAGWLEFSGMLTGAMGKRPTIRVPYAYQVDGSWTSYSTSRKGMWSADLGVTWTYFDTCSINSGGGYIEMRHSTAFPADTIIVSRSRQVSVHNCGSWLAGLLTRYPSLIGPSATSNAYTPGSNLSGYGAQSLIGNEFSQQTQLYYQGTTSNTFTGRTVPPTPFYAAEINDTSLMPPSGPKALGLLLAGVHAGEDLGDVSMQRCVEYLLGNSADAQNVRRYFRILLYPMANAPGRAGGHYRTQYQNGTGGVNDDINRNIATYPAGFQTNDYMRAAWATDFAGEVPAFVLDFHGTYLSNGFAIIKDDAVTLHETFRSRLQTACGFTISDDGNTQTGTVTGYFRDLGTPLFITNELGDQTPKADSLYVTHGTGIVQVLSSMKTDALI